jgi:hypothetical protein
VVLLVKTLDGQEILASSAEPPLGGRHEGRAFLRFDPQAALLFDGESGVRIDRTAPAAKPEPVHAPAESV